MTDTVLPGCRCLAWLRIPDDVNGALALVHDLSREHVSIG
jgi:hypothetical protein